MNNATIQAGQARGPELDRSREEKVQALRALIAECDSLVVAYSGGVDSAYLMHIANDVLGKRAMAVTAKSPSLPSSELEDAKTLAKKFGWQHRVIDTMEMSNPDYTANDPRRCYFCKTELYTRLKDLYPSEEWSTIANGTNADDLGDYRPGLQAADERQVRSPLSEVGLTKDEIRVESKTAGLPTWDKPAQACLSSRIPYGTPVTIQTLSRIESAENLLKELGFTQLRVRHSGSTARIEVPVPDIQRAVSPEFRDQIIDGMHKAGYRYVTLDLEGFRSGNLNESLGLSARSGHKE
jgi:uncharacterized protein